MAPQEQLSDILRDFGSLEDPSETGLAKDSVRAGLFPNKARLLAGKYRLEERLGRGGHGTVRKARDTELDRLVALKFLHGIGPQVAALLLREAKLLARLSHPHVVVVHEVIAESAHGPFIVMEHIDGLSAREWLERDRPRWRSVLPVFRQAAEGLAAVHATGVVHGDFKPENVLVARNGRVYVADFGLSRFSTSLATYDGRPVGSNNATRGRGTIGYVAPEQVTGPGDERSDVFSFCVSLYEGLYGRRPFEGDKLEHYLHNVNDGVGAPPRDARVPRWLRGIVMQGIRSAPEERPASMDVVARALKPPRTGRTIALLSMPVLLGLGVYLGGADGVPCELNTEPLDSAGLSQELATVEALGAPGRQFDEELELATAQWKIQRDIACKRMQQEPSVDNSRIVVRCLQRRATSMQWIVSQVGGQDTQALLRPAGDVLRSYHRDPTCKSEVAPPQDEDGDAGLGAAIEDRIALAKVANQLGQPQHYLDQLNAIPRSLGNLEAAPGHKLWWRMNVGEAQLQVGDLASAETTLRAVVFDTQRSPRRWFVVLGTSQLLLAQVLLASNRLDEARSFAELALAAFESGPAGRGHLGSAWLVLSLIERQANQLTLAADYLRRADASIAVAEVPGVGALRVERSTQRALLAQDTGHHEEAAAAFADALQGLGWHLEDDVFVGRGVGHARSAGLLHNAGVFEMRRGHQANAEALLGEAAGLRETLGLEVLAAQSHTSLANLLAAQDLPGALHHFDRAQVLLRRHSEHSEIYELEYNRAIALHYYGEDPHEAEQAYSRVVRVPTTTTIPLDVRYGALVGRGSVRLLLRQYRAAQADFEVALGMESAAVPAADRAELRWGLARALVDDAREPSPSSEHSRVVALLDDGRRFALAARDVRTAKALDLWIADRPWLR